MSFIRGKQRTLGIDIGSAFIKAAVIDHSGAEPRLVRIASAPLASDAIVDGEVVNPKTVVEALRLIAESLEIRFRRVVTGVGGRDVIVKKVSIDRMREADAREVIAWDAEQYIPFDPGDVQLDIQILDPGGDGAEMDILLVAARKDLVERRSALLVEAGLPPSVVDVDAFALSNAFEYGNPASSNGRDVLVDIGSETTTIVVREAGSPVAIRDVPFGSRHLREDLTCLCGMSESEINRLLAGEVGASAAADELLRTRADDLATAVERATAFLDSGPDATSTIGTACLSGGGARLPRVQEAIARRLRVRTEIANPLQRLEVTPEVAGDIPSDGVGMWMVAVGLALRSRH